MEESNIAILSQNSLIQYTNVEEILKKMSPWPVVKQQPQDKCIIILAIKNKVMYKELQKKVLGNKVISFLLIMCT